MNPKYKKMMFDIIPASAVGREGVEVEPRSEVQPPKAEKYMEVELPYIEKAWGNGLDKLVSDVINVDPKVIVREQLEAVLNEVNEPLVELASIGAVVGKYMEVELPYIKAPIYGSSTSIYEKEGFYDDILAKIREPIVARAAFMPSSVRPRVGTPMFRSSTPKHENIVKTSEARIIKEERIESAVEDFYNKPTEKQIEKLPKVEFVSKSFQINKKSLNFADSPKKRRTGGWFILLIMIGAVIYGFSLKNELVRDGILAFQNLEEAGGDLKEFNFSDAAENFGKSYRELSQISQTMNFMGAGLAGIFPGTNKIKSAKDMVEAGKLIAQSGEAMSKALALLSQTGSILNPADKNSAKPLKIINQIKDAIILSNKNFQKAKALIADIDESVVPEDKKESFGDFKDKLPLLEEYLNKAVEYTDFLEGVVGIDEPKKYLLLFNNNSELRPTGGFPGTYGVVSFAGGGLNDFFVDDVYNLDGQLKRNIIPPKQLQHITPTLGMRDSSWFIDFPMSAKKAMSFFAEEAGYKVDGVVALNPDVISGMLAVVGSVQMPEYGLTLTADNFVESIQEEVEYGNNRDQPKKVVVDFAPRFLAKLYSAGSDKWMKIFDVLMTGLDEKDILFYFNDKELENFSVKEGFGGEIKTDVTDYLTVNFSNIKGSKTDVVTDSAIEIDNRFEGGRVIHKVTLTRNHKGGDHEHGFYNRQNPAYVRVLIPENAELISFSGNDLPDFHSLVSYGPSSFAEASADKQGGFEKDRDVALFESGFYASGFPGVDMFEESGKKGIGFWMITNPKTTKKIEFEYSVPLNKGILSDKMPLLDYNFYFQKQPGLDWKNFKFKIADSKDYTIGGTVPELNRIGDLYLVDEVLKKDFNIKIKLK